MSNNIFILIKNIFLQICLKVNRLLSSSSYHLHHHHLIATEMQFCLFVTKHFFIAFIKNFYLYLSAILNVLIIVVDKTYNVTFLAANDRLYSQQ